MRGRRARALLIFGKLHLNKLLLALFCVFMPVFFPSSIVFQASNDVYYSKMTSAYEGSLIRIFRRLEELIRQMAQAAIVMGSEELKEKFEECLKKIRRDIVAAQSLYL